MTFFDWLEEDDTRMNLIYGPQGAGFGGVRVAWSMYLKQVLPARRSEGLEGADSFSPQKDRDYDEAMAAFILKFERLSQELLEMQRQATFFDWLEGDGNEEWMDKIYGREGWGFVSGAWEKYLEVVFPHRVEEGIKLASLLEFEKQEQRPYRARLAAYVLGFDQLSKKMWKEEEQVGLSLSCDVGKKSRRFSEEELAALYSGRTIVTTKDRPVFLRQVDLHSGKLVSAGNIQEKEIDGLLKTNKLVELKPNTMVVVVPSVTRALLKSGVPFVYVKTINGALHGAIPKPTLHDYALSAFHPHLTGVTYGGYKWSEKDTHTIINFRDGKCSYCNGKPNAHKLYESKESCNYAKVLIELLVQEKWANHSTMVGVLIADLNRAPVIYAAFSGEKDAPHAALFKEVLQKLEKEMGSDGPKWKFARTLQEDDGHLLHDGTDTIEAVRKVVKNPKKQDYKFVMTELKCAAPKLFQAAHRDRAYPLFISEIWYNPEKAGKSTRRHGEIAESCNLCRMSTPPMLCARNPILL